MPKKSTIGPFRVEEQMRAGLERMAAAEGEDVTVADVVRSAIREYLARHLPPEAEG